MFSSQQLESVTQLIAKEDRNAPEHTQRLYSAGGLHLAHVRRLPTELVEDFGDGLFRRVVGFIREDRSPEDATTVAEIKKMYAMQKKRQLR